MSDNQSNLSGSEMNTSDASNDAGTDQGRVFRDEPLPNWWKLIFVATIAFAPPYFFWFHNGAPGRTAAERYDAALAANLRLQFAEIGELSATRENVLKFLYEDSWLKVGRAVFKSNCVSCHGSEGGGLAGPNLCDDSYKNIKEIGDILKVLQNGAGGGAMPAWQGKLSPNELVLVSSYVASLRGSNPATAKPAEGQEIAAWPPKPVEQETSAEASSETDSSPVEGE